MRRRTPPACRAPARISGEELAATHESDRFHEEVKLSAVGSTFTVAACNPRFGSPEDCKEHDDREENPRQANNQKRVAPSEVFANPATGWGFDSACNRDTQGVCGERGRSFGFGM